MMADPSFTDAGTRRDIPIFAATGALGIWSTAT